MRPRSSRKSRTICVRSLIPPSPLSLPIQPLGDVMLNKRPHPASPTHSHPFAPPPVFFILRKEDEEAQAGGEEKLVTRRRPSCALPASPKPGVPAPWPAALDVPAETDWRRSTYLNLLSQTAFTLSVAVVASPECIAGADAGTPPLYSVSKACTRVQTRRSIF